eukprot:gene801-1554_t
MEYSKDKIAHLFLVHNEQKKLISAIQSKLPELQIEIQELISLLEKDELKRFRVFEEDNDIYVSRNELSASDEVLQAQICDWRNSLYFFFAEKVCNSIELSRLGTEVRKPPSIPGHIKLKDVLTYDPLQRFLLYGENNNIKVTRNVTEEDLLEYTEKWKVSISKFILSKNRAVAISELGSEVPRPSQLPKSVKLLETLRTDHTQRFLIIELVNDFLVKRILTPEEKEEYAKYFTHEIELWRNNIAEYLSRQLTPIIMSEIGVNVRRPEGLPSEFKLQKILQSDPHHRFVFKGKGNDVRIRLSNGYRAAMNLSTMQKSSSCDASPISSCSTTNEEGGWIPVGYGGRPASNTSTSTATTPKCTRTRSSSAGTSPSLLSTSPCPSGGSGRGSGGGYGFPFGMQDITTTATTSSTTSTPGPGPWNLMTRQYGGSSNSNYDTAIRQMDHTPPPKSSSSSSSSVNDNIQYSHPMSLSSSASSAPLSLCLPAPPLHWQQQEQDDDFHEGIEPFLENSSPSYFSVDPMTSIPSSPIPNPAANSNTHTNSNTGPPPPGFLSSPWSQSATSALINTHEEHMYMDTQSQSHPALSVVTDYSIRQNNNAAFQGRMGLSTYNHNNNNNNFISGPFIGHNHVGNMGIPVYGSGNTSSTSNDCDWQSRNVIMQQSYRRSYSAPLATVSPQPASAHSPLPLPLNNAATAAATTIDDFSLFSPRDSNVLFSYNTTTATTTTTTLTTPIADWFYKLFAGFEIELIQSFINKLRDEGFVLMQDLQYAYVEGQLSGTWLENKLNMKLGHRNRLFEALDALKINNNNF